MPIKTFPQDIEASLKAQTEDILKLGGTYSFDMIRSREFYSCYLFAPGLAGVIPAGKYEVFKASQSDIGQGYADQLSARETNWLQPGRTPDQQNLITQALHVDIRRAPTDTRVYKAGVLPSGAVDGKVDLSCPPHIVDVLRVAYGAQLHLKYLTDSWPLGLLADFPAPGGTLGQIMASRQLPGAGPGLTAGTPADLLNIDPRGYLPVARQSTVAAFERRTEIPYYLQHAKQFSMEIVISEDIQLLGVNPASVDETPLLNDASGCLEVFIGFWAVESFWEQS